MKVSVLVKIESELHKRIKDEAKKSGMLVAAKYNEALSIGVAALRLRNHDEAKKKLKKPPRQGRLTCESHC